MPFCGKFLAEDANYEACVPVYNELYPDHTVLKKDAVLGQRVSDWISVRVSREENETLQDEREEMKNPATKEMVGAWEPRFSSALIDDDEACKNAWKRFACYMNFPRCNSEQQVGLDGAGCQRAGCSGALNARAVIHKNHN